MKTFTQKVYIHKSPRYTEQDFFVFTHDASESGYPLLGTQEIELNVPDTDPVEAEIQMLANKAHDIETKAYAEVENIKDRIKELQGIEYKPEAGE